jgi:hypothetical protein
MDAANPSPGESVERHGGPPPLPASAADSKLARLTALVFDGSAPWLVSMIVQASLVLVLGLWVLPLASSVDLEGIAYFSSGEEVAVSDELAMLTSSPLAAAPSGGAAGEGSSISSAGHSSAAGPIRLADATNIEAISLTSAGNSGTELPPAGALDGPGTGKGRRHITRPVSSTELVRGAADVAGAVNVFTNAIRSEMDQGDTLVVWLIDQSISLHGDRMEIAEQLEPFFKSIKGFNELRKNSGREYFLSHAVVAYGRTSFERQKPIPLGWRVVKEVRDIPPDLSGMENVMSAIQRCVYYYRGTERRKDRMIIVVWTDESGDDTHYLEPTIALCREAGIAVHIVGPSAVLGSDRGSHLWTHESGQRYYLPVTRGPESSFPERAILAYWYSGPRFWEQDGVQVAKNVAPEGGPFKERVLSGFGPWALTRLALQTGGTFTIYDRPADRPKYQLEDLRDYLPDYGSREEYVASLQGRPLRLALNEVAVLTHLQYRNFYPPQFSFFASRSQAYPFDSFPGYIPPPAFRGQLKKALDSQADYAARMEALARKALALLEKKGEDLEYEYKQEPSKRWRAWYDLNRGRLLATSVRAREYAYLCRLILRHPERALGENTNYLAFGFKAILRVKTSTADAEEAQRLLQRCVQSNPKTPWADFAQWELDVPLGLDFVTRDIPQPPPPPPPRGGGTIVRPSGPPAFPRL